MRNCGLPAWTYFLIILVGRIHAHGPPIDVVLVDNQLSPFISNGRPVFDPAFLVQTPDSDKIASSSPGLGVTNASNGIPSSTKLGLDVVSALGYFDGQRVAHTDSKLQIVAPDGQDVYLLNANSPTQSGMSFGKYTGVRNWDAHGEFSLSPNTSEAGIYGTMVQLTSPTFESSEPFLLPLVYDPTNQFDEATTKQAILQLTEFLSPNNLVDPNDLNADGWIDGADVDMLCTIVGSPESLAGLSESEFALLDINVDDRLSQADVTQWLAEVDSLEGDTNLDGAVDFEDFLIFSQNFGTEGSDATWTRGDFDCDQSIVFVDFLSLSSSFGQSATAKSVQSVPEPSAWVPVFLGGLFLIGSMRQ